MIEIPPGEFIMGSRGYGAVEEFDEAPAHLVRISKPLRMSATEITNAQYERYDPAHRALRGKAGFSVDDDEAVVFVSYDDALGFLPLAFAEGGKELSAADRSGVGICLPGGQYDPVQYWDQRFACASTEGAEI